MKRLLILGATYHEIDIIRRAQDKGIYVIATDNNSDWSKSPAKYVADEAWNISWSDVDRLVEKSRDSKIDGVFAGFSEFRVEKMIILCEKLGLPCTLSMEQLNITRDKNKFKRLCENYNIKVVHEYEYNDVNYPVIIKPVDRAGSIGINVAYNNHDLERFYKIAYDLSPSNSVIIEDFIEDGIKVDFYYYVKDKKIVLLGTSDTIMCEGELGAPILQKAWVFPSRYESRFLLDEDAKIREMLCGIGMCNGYATMSAFYRNGNFYFFEAGFRLSGELSYNYYNYISGINYIDTLVDYSLGIPNEDAYENCYKFRDSTKSVILNYYGINGAIENIEMPILQIADSLKVIADFYVQEGDCVDNETNVFKKVAMYTIISDDEMEIEDTIKSINSNLHILDTDGVDLIYERLDEKCLGYSYKVEINKGLEIKLMQKPYWIQWSEIQMILNEAHATNLDSGLVYATYNQSISQLKHKTKNGICLIAMVDDVLAATATIQFRTIDHWYHSGYIGLLKLLAVIPRYRGNNLASLLTKTILLLSAKKQVPLIVSDSAEENMAIRHLYLSEGFIIVDCCKYPENNFISTVYAKWLTTVPFSTDTIDEYYCNKRKQF